MTPLKKAWLTMLVEVGRRVEGDYPRRKWRMRVGGVYWWAWRKYDRWDRERFQRKYRNPLPAFRPGKCHEETFLEYLIRSKRRDIRLGRWPIVGRRLAGLVSWGEGWLLRRRPDLLIRQHDTVLPVGSSACVVCGKVPPFESLDLLTRVAIVREPAEWAERPEQRRARLEAMRRPRVSPMVPA